MKQRCEGCQEAKVVAESEFEIPIVIWCGKHNKNRAAGAFCLVKEVDENVTR